MKEKLIKYDTARLIKELGFNEETIALYDSKGIVIRNPGYTKNEELIRNYASAPTQSFLQKWLRENHNIHLCVQNKLSPSNTNMFYLYKHANQKLNWDNYFATYEEALEKGLLTALKMIEN